MIENNDLGNSKDILGQELPSVFIKLEEIEEKKKKRKKLTTPKYMFFLQLRLDIFLC